VTGLVTAFIAGLLTTLNPCVLPMIPMVVSSASAVGRFAPLALATGLVGSFTLLGVGLAALGPAIGIDAALVRQVAAFLLVVAGFVLFHPPTQLLLLRLLAPVADAAQQASARLSLRGTRGQFVLGILLGAVWSPCVGPTLGVAAALAANGQDLAHGTLTMAVFGTGMASVFLLVGYSSRSALARHRGLLARSAVNGRRVFGVLLAGSGLLVLSGLDRVLEAQLTRLMPAWLLELTTRY
jgi:cytochrome c biogenesis protein CcdA